MRVHLTNAANRRTAATSIAEASIDREVQQTLLRWKRAGVEDCVLIGGLAMAFHAKPRYTQDVDFLFKKPSYIPDDVEGFRRHRPGALEDKRTGVEVEVVTPESFQPPLPAKRVSLLFDTSAVIDGLRVASAEGLIALKLHAASNNPKRELQDLGDIANLLNHGLHLDPQEFSNRWGLDDREFTLLVTVHEKVSG